MGLGPWILFDPGGVDRILRDIDIRNLMDPIGTPLKINMAHNHGGLEDHVPF